MKNFLILLPFLFIKYCDAQIIPLTVIDYTELGEDTFAIHQKNIRYTEMPYTGFGQMYKISPGRLVVTYIMYKGVCNQIIYLAQTKEMADIMKEYITKDCRETSGFHYSCIPYDVEIIYEPNSDDWLFQISNK